MTPEEPKKLTKIRVVCGNPSCRDVSLEPRLEINFFTNEIVYLCPVCDKESKIVLTKAAVPLPRTRLRR